MDSGSEEKHWGTVLSIHIWEPQVTRAGRVQVYLQHGPKFDVYQSHTAPNFNLQTLMDLSVDALYAFTVHGGIGLAEYFRVNPDTWVDDTNPPRRAEGFGPLKVSQ